MAIRIGDIGDGAGRGAVDQQWVLGRYYAGEAVPCPVGCGGVAEVVRTGSREGGGGELWVECGSCAQRARYAVPEATDEERREVWRALEAGEDPLCGRHATPPALQRRGHRLVCPACGVRYRD
ncbi:MAG TPA: hypothetical protein VF188_14910 [Longimicrobiales bacterium]